MNDAASPSLFGFRIRSEVPLRFLREGGGVEPLEVVVAPPGRERPAIEPLGEWPLHGSAAPAQATLYARPGGFEYWTSDAGRFAIDFNAGRIEMPAEGDEILREQRLNGMPMLLAFAQRGDFSLHAAAVEIGGGAMILAAPSRFGKTTLALAFAAQGHRLLTEDLVCVRPTTLAVIPGPAVARLRPDVFAGAPPAGMEVIAERPDRVFLAPIGGGRGSSAPLPIRGLCLLREGEALGAVPAASIPTVQDLWHLGFRLPTAHARAESFKQLTRLATEVPVWNVTRPLRLDLLDATVDLIAGLMR